MAISALQELGEGYDALWRLMQDSEGALDLRLTALRRQQGRGLLLVQGEPQDNAYRATLAAVMAVYTAVREAFRPDEAVTSDPVRAAEFWCYGGQPHPRCRRRPNDPFDFEFVRQHFDVLCARFKSDNLPDFAGLRCEARGELASALYTADGESGTPADRPPPVRPAHGHALLGSVRHLFAVPVDAEHPGPFVVFVRFQPGAQADVADAVQEVHRLELACLEPRTWRADPVDHYQKYGVVLDGPGGSPFEWIYAVGLHRLRTYEQAAGAAAACLPDLELREGRAVTDDNLQGCVDAVAAAADLWTAYAYRQLRRAGLLQSRAILDGKATAWWYPADAFAASLVAIQLAGREASDDAAAPTAVATTGSELEHTMSPPQVDNPYRVLSAIAGRVLEEELARSAVIGRTGARPDDLDYSLRHAARDRELQQARRAALRGPLPNGCTRAEVEGRVDALIRAVLELVRWPQQVPWTPTANLYADLIHRELDTRCNDVLQARQAVDALAHRFDDRPAGPAPAKVEWSTPQAIKTWARVFGCHRNTMTARLTTGGLRCQQVGRDWMIALDDLPSHCREKYRRPAE
jgi:hypothetical protein